MIRDFMRDVVQKAHSQARNTRNALIDFIAQDNALAALELDDLFSAAARKLEDFPMPGKQGRIKGRRTPDPTARAYLKVIEKAPDVVTAILAR